MERPSPSLVDSKAKIGNRKTLAYILGALRDGTFIKNEKYHVYRIRFYQKNKEWLLRLSQILFRYFGKMPRLLIDKRDNVWQLVIDSKKIFEYLQTTGEYPGNQRQWRIPKWIIQGGKETQKGYVKGFFDSEGGIPHFEKGAIKPKNAKIYFAQASKECLQDLKVILTELDFKTGMVSGPYYKKNYINPIFALRIHGIGEMVKFSRRIGSMHPEKIRRFEIASSLSETP